VDCSCPSRALLKVRFKVLKWIGLGLPSTKKKELMQAPGKHLIRVTRHSLRCNGLGSSTSNRLSKQPLSFTIRRNADFASKICRSISTSLTHSLGGCLFDRLLKCVDVGLGHIPRVEEWAWVLNLTSQGCTIMDGPGSGISTVDASLSLEL
jgi:hypothetical protein